MYILQKEFQVGVNLVRERSEIRKYCKQQFCKYSILIPDHERLSYFKLINWFLHNNKVRTHKLADIL